MLTSRAWAAKRQERWMVWWWYSQTQNTRRLLSLWSNAIGLRAAHFFLFFSLFSSGSSATDVTSFGSCAMYVWVASMSEKHFAWYRSDSISRLAILRCFDVWTRQLWASGTWEEKKWDREREEHQQREKKRKNNNSKKNKHYYWGWDALWKRIKDDKNVCSYRTVVCSESWFMRMRKYVWGHVRRFMCVFVWPEGRARMYVCVYVCLWVCTKDCVGYCLDENEMHSDQ